MSETQQMFRIGTSGWSYPASAEGSWNGIFYPPGKVDELHYYAERFNMVEVNSTFYRPPAAGYVWNWVRKTPADFEFTIKLWQKFTHPGMFAERTGQDSEIAQSDVDTFKKGMEPLVKSKKVLLVALGVRKDESKELLGFQLANSESESWWWGFLSDLKQRGLSEMSDRPVGHIRPTG